MLDVAGAEQLVMALLRHSKIPLNPDLIHAVISGSEGHPYVIQHLIDRLRRLGAPTVSDVAPTLTTLLRPPGDPLDLRHYAQRLHSYYDEEEAKLALDILDMVALDPSGPTIDRLHASLDGYERDTVLETVRHLEEDFYLSSADRRIRFIHEFVRRFWIEERAL